MADEPVPEIDRTKIRIGLAMISAVVVVAVVLVFVIEAAAGKALMFAVAAVAFVRAYLLTRSLKAERRP